MGSRAIRRLAVCSEMRLAAPESRPRAPELRALSALYCVDGATHRAHEVAGKGADRRRGQDARTVASRFARAIADQGTATAARSPSSRPARRILVRSRFRESETGVTLYEEDNGTRYLRESKAVPATCRRKVPPTIKSVSGTVRVGAAHVPCRLHAPSREDLDRQAVHTCRGASVEGGMRRARRTLRPRNTERRAPGARVPETGIRGRLALSLPTDGQTSDRTGSHGGRLPMIHARPRISGSGARAPGAARARVQKSGPIPAAKSRSESRSDGEIAAGPRRSRPGIRRAGPRRWDGSPGASAPPGTCRRSSPRPRAMSRR